MGQKRHTREARLLPTALALLHAEVASTGFAPGYPYQSPNRLASLFHNTLLNPGQGIIRPG